METTPISELTSEQLIGITAAQNFIRELAQQKPDIRLVFHNDFLCEYLETEVKDLAAQENANPETQFVSRLAALFYPVGFRFNPADAFSHSKTQFQQFSLLNNLSDEIEKAVLLTINEAANKKPKTLAGQLLCDAVASLKLETESNSWPDLALLEKELFGQKIDRTETAQLQLQELLNVHFFTTAARRKWHPFLSKSLISQKKKVEKLLRNQGEQNALTTTLNETTTYAGIESGVPLRAAQTYFRTVYRNHINLSAIADNKANIMISVNSILISVLITFLSYRNIAETQPIILLPVVIFLVAGLASLVFAVLSARPKVTTLNNSQTPMEERKKNLIFFGNFVDLDIQDYENAMNEILHDGNLLYGNMVRDLFHLGKVLDEKYRFLSISYNIFMVGLIVTVALFLITLF